MRRLLAFLLCSILAFAGVTYPPQKSGLTERDVTGTTATDTILASDCGNPVVYSGSVAVAVTLPTAITLGNVFCAFTLTNQTSGASTALTVTPTTWSIVPATAGVVAQNQTCRFTVNQAGNGWVAVCSNSINGGAGGSVTLTGPSAIYYCTGTCTITLPVPPAAPTVYQFCIFNDDNVSTVITLAALGSSARYEATARTSYGTAGTGTLVSGGAVKDMVCIVSRDATHYATTNFIGTWTAN